ncbi:unnamed protein product [Rhizoctonia solani]|uniref:F-box domain-containing protein n=1 Tax=Rhizoctonia solani TaxID=456999 RepID=A0A8H3E087_9AGAM|nr:unnamed protein product [Rhizoctonia solani]
MLSQVHTDRAVLRVFGIPELAHLICSVIQRYDNVSLMQTCHQLFHNILPFVWEQVDQADALISMIPGGGTVTHNSDLLPYVVMQLPSCLDLTRFNVYAPYVKRFSPSTPYVDEYAGWESFLSCVRSIDLLPNLETIYLPVRDHNEYSYGDVKAIDTDCVNWVTAFLSSSLRTLQLGYRKQGPYWNNRGAPWMDFIHAERTALRVFGIPELAHLICGTIPRYDNVSLMQTCRQLFHNILPFVWERVDQADTLVSLIPGGGVVTYNLNPDLLPYMVMQLPSRLDLTRFNIYAPYVKRFSPSTPYVDEYAGWESFLSCVRSIDLLPNLETIYLPVRDHNEYSYGDVKAIDTDCVNWVTAFLSSSLRTLQLGYWKQGPYWNNRGAPWMDFSLFDSLMAVVFQKCSGLRSLSILPVSIRHDGPRSQRGSFSRDVPQAYSNFLQLKNLSSLRVSSAILNLEALAALSVLPSLEALCIHGSGFDRHISCEGLELPTEAFPALKHLELIAQDWENIGNLCNAKPIVFGLHSLTIEYPSHQSEGRYHGLHDIIPLLAANNSSIANLVVHGLRYTSVPPNILQSWGQLPLISLHLEWSFDPEQAFSIVYSIVSCLPLLEVLKLSIPYCAFDLRELRTIVEHLPRLRHLWAPLESSSVTELVEGDFTPCRSRSDVNLCLESNFYLPSPQKENAERLARYLSILRPTTTVICKSYQKSFYHRAVGYCIDEGPKDMINAELSRLRLN